MYIPIYPQVLFSISLRSFLIVPSRSFLSCFFIAKRAVEFYVRLHSSSFCCCVGRCFGPTAFVDKLIYYDPIINLLPMTLSIIAPTSYLLSKCYFYFFKKKHEMRTKFWILSKILYNVTRGIIFEAKRYDNGIKKDKIRFDKTLYKILNYS